MLLLLIVSLFASALTVRPARAQTIAQNATVLLTATVSDPSQGNPPQIVLHFPVDPNASGYTISRKLVSDARFPQIGTISAAAAPTATSYTDNTVSVGIPYEYQVAKGGATGYVVSGIRVPLPGATADGSRGKIIVITCSDAIADPRIAAGMSRLTQDLVGDGWTVISHTVGRDAGMNAAGVMNDHGAAVFALKALIRNDYNADPSNVKTVLLFGHVPVPYSGDSAVDGHINHTGAWPADVYYGDMGPENHWTDTAVNDTTADNPRNYNVPGDGKFDQGSIPGPIALEVGRVDLANMYSFNSKTENDLLAQYLDKDHNYRQGLLNISPVGRVNDNFQGADEAFASSGFRNFAPFFGASAVTISSPAQLFPPNYVGGQLFPDLQTGNFQWTYACGPGGPTGAGGVGGTPDFGANDPHSVFYMLFGSFFGDWGYGFDPDGVHNFGDDFLRAPLATTTYGLTCSWAGRPHWYYQHMGLGSEIGFAARLTQNNGGTYQPVGSGAQGIQVALMGDPTLRENVVPPASGLSAVANGSDVALNWTASPQIGFRQPSPVIGYNVYRQDVPGGPWTLLNTSGLVTTTAYTDAGVSAFPRTYQVRAVCLQTTPSGTYYNQSQGIYQAYDSGHVAPTVALVAPLKTVPFVIPSDPLIFAQGVGFIGSPTAPATLTLAAQATSSIPNDPKLTVTFYVNSTPVGTATTVPYQFPIQNSTLYPNGLPPGYYTLSAVATDGQGATVASNSVPVYVFNIPESPNQSDTGNTPSPPTPPLATIFGGGALTAGWSDISNKNNNLMSDSLGSPASINLNKPGSAFVLSHTPIDTSLYPDLILVLTLTGNTDPTKPGGQKIIITAPNQDSVMPKAVTLPGNNTYNTFTIKLGGIVGAGERGRNFDGLNIRDAAGNVDASGNTVATPTFYISNIHLDYTYIRPKRAAGVAIHLDQAKFSAANQPITAKGDAATSDGAVTEVDLYLNGKYIGRGTGRGNTPGMLYSPYDAALATLAPGSYSLQANAITSFGTTSQSTPFTFAVIAPPTIAITAPANNAAFPTGSPLTITASASAATGANLTKVQFFVSTDGGMTSTEIGPDQTTGGPYQVSYTPPAPGAYVFTATATDDATGVTTSSPVNISVGNPPAVAISSPATGATFVAPASFSVTATATAGSNPISKVDFFGNGTLIGTATTAPYTINLTNIPAGTYALTATVTDSIGLTATSAPPVSVVVNAPPTVTITAPTAGAVFAAPATLLVTATATAGSNPISKVDFFANGTLIGTATAAPYTVSFANVPAGTYALTAKVTDSIGLNTTSTPVSIVVNTPPTVAISSPAGGASFVTPATFSVTATATAGSSPISKIDFFANGTLIGTATAAPYTVSFANVPVGTYALTAKVTDSAGLTATSAPVSVTVVIPHTFHSGLQMFSVPYDYSASGLALPAIFGIPNPRLVDWDPVATIYTVPTTLKLGLGYWANFPAGAGLVVKGTPASTSQPFTSALSRGWNIIGDPFLAAAPWSSMTVTGPDGKVHPMTDAVAQNLIGPNLYTYDQNTQGYDTLPLSSGMGSLNPCAGYWIYAGSSLTLSVAPPAQ